MATQDGIAVTYTAPISTNFNELLLALYTAFDGGLDANWQIKAGVGLPTPIGSVGDTGFVIEDVATSTINILIADHAGVGGVMLDGGAIAAADDLLVAIDPGGGVTDITTAGFTASARVSGWAADVQGSSSSTLSGRSIVVSGTDWILIRHKAGAAGYTAGIFAGKYSRLDSGLGDGFCVFGGLWTDYASTSTNTDHCGIEARSGVWINTPRMLPLNTTGLTGDYASDGAGTWRLCPVMIAIPSGTFSSTMTSWTVVGTCPALYTGPSGTIAVQWKDGGSVVKAVCLDGGAWLCRSDGVVAE